MGDILMRCTLIGAGGVEISCVVGGVPSSTLAAVT